jgi:pyruvate formate lyase activating enzyme
VSVLDALRELGRVASDAGLQEEIFQPLCGTGGCWNCAVLIDGMLARSCVTPLREEMEIITGPEIYQLTEPLRIVTLMRPPPHYHPSVFTHGCNYGCDLCHNWEMTFSSNGRAMSPAETVPRLNLNPEQDYWVGISGGEPTLNRKWLVELVRVLRQEIPDGHIQLDTNASLLTSDYIDELAASGITDISPDLKAHRLDTFMKICGIRSRNIAQQYMETSWNAVRYLNDTYREKIFMAVSLPCHPRIHSKAELEETARTIAKINPEMPISLIEYQPAFRLRDWPSLSSAVMDQARQIMESAGLQKVIVQGGQAIPRAVDPLDLSLSSENF